MYDAIYVLWVNCGDVRFRLINAYMMCYALSADHFPKDLVKEWEWIVKQLTKFGPLYKYNGEIWKGVVEYTMMRIKNKTGRKIAEKIFDLYFKIHRINQHNDY